MRKKHTTSLLALVVALLLCLGSFSTAFAADTAPAVETSEAAITKVLKVPYGTEVPNNMTYNFVVEAVEVDEEAYDAGTSSYNDSDDNMPTIGTPSTTADGTGTFTLSSSALTLDDTAAGITTYYLETADIFASVTWPHAGVYEYKITETATTYSASASDPQEILVDSKAEYRVLVYVMSCPGGTGHDGQGHTAGELEITHIGVLKVIDDDNTSIDPIDQVKVDPTPGGDNGATCDYSQMIFTNTYAKINGGGDPEDDADWNLFISKEVAGDFADPNVYFDFKMTLTAPTIIWDGVIGAAPTYKAYVVEADGSGYKVVTDSNNYAGSIDLTNKFFTVTAGSEFEFSLKHGQFLVFTDDLHVGTSYVITELEANAYLPKATVVYDGDTPATETGTLSQALVLPGTTVTAAYLWVGEDTSSAAFLNTRNAVTPTGFDLSTLPFVGLLVLVAGAFVSFVMVKASRKRRYN